MASVTVEYLGIEATGRTVTEAKRKASAIAERLVKAPPPRVVSVGEARAIAYYGIGGWSYGLLHDDTDSICWHTTTAEDWDDLLFKIRCHLGQITWKAEYGMVHPLLSDAENKELRSWFDFQIRYKTAKDAGFDHQDAYDYASRNPANKAVWSLA